MKVDEMSFYKKNTPGRRLVASLSAEPTKDELWNEELGYHEIERIRRFKIGIDEGVDLLDLYIEAGNEIIEERELLAYRVNCFRAKSVKAAKKQLKKEGLLLEHTSNGRIGGRYFIVKNAEESIKRVHTLDNRQKKLKIDRKFLKLIAPELIANTNKKTRLGNKAIIQLEDFIAKR